VVKDDWPVRMYSPRAPPLIRSMPQTFWFSF
jgi:hypothetical protein